MASFSVTMQKEFRKRNIKTKQNNNNNKKLLSPADITSGISVDLSHRIEHVVSMPHRTWFTKPRLSAFIPVFRIFHFPCLPQGRNRKAGRLWSPENLLSVQWEGSLQVFRWHEVWSLTRGRLWHGTKSYLYHLLQLARPMSAANCDSQFSPVGLVLPLRLL